MKNIPEALDYRQILEQLQIELVRETQGRDELAIETSPDSLDQIQHASERDYAMGALERRVERLREVRDALQRIQQQTYGICDECEESISPKRLAAIPWAPLCIKCQHSADQQESTALEPAYQSFAMEA
ncbi:MAG: TraR/DksA family transcriptional regulator [Acidobacteria bacterium]|nr:TraR/DksA family transcriptional regulator [Acidobacteriota bacterium]